MHTKHDQTSASVFRVSPADLDELISFSNLVLPPTSLVSLPWHNTGPMQHTFHHDLQKVSLLWTTLKLQLKR